jgi:transposase
MLPAAFLMFLVNNDERARLWQQGMPEAEVARRVGVHRQSVNRWAQQLAKGGRSGAVRTGRPPQLSAADCKGIEEGLKGGPEALGTSGWRGAWPI